MDQAWRIAFVDRGPSDLWFAVDMAEEYVSRLQLVPRQFLGPEVPYISDSSRV